MSELNGDEWARPQPVTDLDLAFPARGLELMPPESVCLRGLEALDPEVAESWLELQSRWFSKGLPEGVEFYMVPGVDGATAVRHLQVVQGCYGSRHEYKTVAVAYLASRWLVKVVYND